MLLTVKCFGTLSKEFSEYFYSNFLKLSYKHSLYLHWRILRPDRFRALLAKLPAARNWRIHGSFRRRRSLRQWIQNGAM